MSEWMAPDEDAKLAKLAAAEAAAVASALAGNSF